MKRRIFAFLMALVMVVSTVPLEAFAAGYGDVYGENLGWEYAAISTNRNGGYTLQNPQSNSGYGTYYGDKVQVTFITGSDAVAVSEGSNGVQQDVLASDSTTNVRITCDYGYYISAVVLACAHQGNPFQCQTVATDNAYALAQPGSTLNSVTIRMSDLYDWAHHQSSVATYYLMIELEPIPANVYVGYDSGTAGTTAIQARPVTETGTLSDGATQVSSYPTWNYVTTGLTAAPTHTALGINPEAEAEANALGYAFAGWKLEYYSVYTTSNNTFSGNMSVGGNNLPQGTTVTMTLNAKLTAIWQPLTNITVSKVWSDADNQDGLRPDSITVHLLRNGTHTGSPVTLNASNNWTATWTVPQLDEDGNVITYAVEETVPSGYTCVVTGDAASGFVLTNTHVTERTNIQVQKIWTDDTDRDGLRPYGVVLQLYKNGQPLESYTDSSGNVISGTAIVTNGTSWTQQWLDLEKNKPGEVGVANVYTVVEIGYVDANGNAIDNPGYTVSYGTDETGRLVVENTHEVGRVDIAVSKVWNDDNNRDNIRPESVTITLYANGIRTSASAVLNAGNNWTYKWENLYEYYRGSKIQYTVVEESVPTGYTAAVTGDAVNGFTVTNTHVPEIISVPVTKVWNDNENQDGIRPTQITVALYADGVATGKTLDLNDGNGWSGSFTGLDKYKAGSVGTLINYTVQEVTVPTGYTASVDGTTITNTHVPETVNLVIRKSWNDGNNQDGKRPYAVVITLYENGTPTGHTFTLDGTVDTVETSPWQAILANMPKYKNGQRISYTLVETGYYATATSALTQGTPPDYTVTHSYDTTTDPENPVGTVINSYTPEVTALNVQKVWADNNNQDGKRPASITVTLYQKIGDGEWTAVKDSAGNDVTAVMNSGNEWDVDFTGLPRYSGGQPITYTVRENTVEGYTTTYSEVSAAGVVTITNTHTPEKTAVSVTKAWNDGNNQDGLRAESVVVELLINGSSSGKTLTLSSANNWTGTFGDLDKYYQGTEISYTVTELNVPTGYTAVVSGSAEAGYTVTNVHTPAVVSVPVAKIWADNNDQDGLRTESVTIALLADGVEVKTLVLDQSNSWKSSFTGLPKYKNGGTEIVYTVAEKTVPTGYTAVISGDAVNGYTVTNTHEVEMTSVQVSKVWADSDNQDGLRPDSITLHLYANGVHLPDKTVTIGASDNWSYQWTDLPKYEEAKEINYTVYEEVVDGYTVSYVRAADDSLIITNTRETDKTYRSVQKVWIDANNQDNIRPYGVAVQLYANGVAYGTPVVLTADGHWIHNWTGLPLNSDGAAITYTVKEEYYVDAAGARIELDDVAYSIGTPTEDPLTGVILLPNTHEVQKTDITVTKKWEDQNNRDNARPDSIQVTLFRNGQPYDTAELTKANGWTYTWTGLDVHHGIGIDNVYTVAETNVPDGYTASADGFVITNTREIETISVPVRKVWTDGGDQDGLRPDGIVVALYADGVQVAVKTLTAGTNWTGEFRDMPKYQENAVGVPIAYTFKEIGYVEDGKSYDGIPTGYTASVSGSIITNTHTPETADLNVRKAWNDGSNNDATRPYAVEITLYLNGQPHPTAQKLVLSPANGWKGTWENMPRYQGGQRISYSVVETGYYATEEDLTNGKRTEGVPAGYTVTHSYDTSDPTHPVAVVTNSYTPATTGINVQKVWDDDNNRDNVRPAEITVTLYRKIGNGQWETVLDGDGNPLTAVMNPANEWDATFTGLPKYIGGRLVTYNVVESDVEGYEATEYSYDPATGVVTITNSRTVGRVDLAVTKAWNDSNDQDGIRPDSVQVTLYANGIRTSQTVTLDASNGWSYTWENLYEYYHGQKIVYTVVEEKVSEGYTVAITGNAKTGYTITNTHTPDTISIPVSKTWNDTDDQDGIRPDSITVTLYANGKAVKDLTITAESNWMGSFGDLPVNENGKAITYTVKEKAIEGYTATYSAGDKTEGVLAFTVTNTHETEKTQLTAVKVWADNNDQDGKRPASITVHLLADGVHTGKTVVITELMGWTYTWKDLQKYAGGQEIRYTVYEEPVYFKGVTPGTANNDPAARVVDTYFASYVRNPEDPTQITITNAYTPETTVITAMKVWDDSDNRDGLRPESVTVELYIDGVASGKTLVLNDANSWVDSWTGLPKYKDQGVEIKYSVVETVVPTGYEVTVVQETEFAPGLFILTNTHVPAVTGVKVHKIWNDESDNDGKRPDGIIVQLYANGSAVEGAKAVLSDENRWTYEWLQLNGEPLYVYHQGKEVSYYVDEIGYVIDGKEYEGLPDGYTKETSANSYTVSITNTRATEKTSVTVVKAWDDSNNNDGIRPESIEVTLYRNGEALNTVTLNEANKWTHTWEGLYKYVAGEAAVYTVTETAVEGYTATYTETAGDKGTTWTVTNTHETEDKELTVKKIWVDDNDAEGLRPDSVTVQLYANGKAYGDVITLSAANGWKHTVSVPVYENGEQIKWTIVEPKIPRYYSASYNQDTLTVTNSIQSKDVPKTGDPADLVFWIGMSIVFSAGAVAVLFFDRKRNYTKA